MEREVAILANWDTFFSGNEHRIYDLKKLNNPLKKLVQYSFHSKELFWACPPDSDSTFLHYLSLWRQKLDTLIIVNQQCLHRKE